MKARLFGPALLFAVGLMLMTEGLTACMVPPDEAGCPSGEEVSLLEDHNAELQLEVEALTAENAEYRQPLALLSWDDNGDGRITCAEARGHGITPVTSTHSAYPLLTDGDGDGIVCEGG